MRYISLFAILLSSLIHPQIFAQNPKEYESFDLITDKSLYYTNEEINFLVINQSSDQVKSLHWSKTIYVELISPEGKSYYQSKLPLSPQGAEGILRIPSDLSSGTYYLRTYSRWMKNMGPEYFTYISVSILNPFSNKTMVIDTSTNRKLLVPIKYQPTNFNQIDINTNINISIRDSASFSLNKIDPDIDIKYLTILREGLFEQQFKSKKQMISTEIIDYKYIPETKGVSFSGKVIEETNQNPCAYAKVFLTTLDKERNFFCTYTDSIGKFYFSFPEYSGDKELFVSAFKDDFTKLELLIDTDFSNEFIKMPSFPIKILNNNSTLANELSIYAQIENQYTGIQDSQMENKDSIIHFFYGNPSKVIFMKDYIKLPVLEEYFIELLPQASVRKSNKKKKFIVNGQLPELKLFDPLVLIDGVAIFDIEAILKIAPAHIQRIEIVDLPYVKGDITFGGIINIISNNDNLAYVDLPSSGILFNYKMLSNLEDQEIRLKPSSKLHIPDFRNTLFRKSFLTEKLKNNELMNFRSNDISGNYQFIIHTFDKETNYIQMNSSFEIVK